jgi:hypothetical protein
MAKYETLGGYVTKAETFAKLQHHLKEAEDMCYTISHLMRTESGHKDELLAAGFRGIGQLLARVSDQILKLGQGKLQ